MSVNLTYIGQTTLPVEVEGLTPDWAVDKTLAEIERFEISHGNRKLPLAELFRVTGDASDRQIEFVGDLSGVHWIGAHMASGRITIQGHAGRHLGSEMRGGELEVQGSASDWLGAEMHGGFIHVHGNAGDLVGGAYRGAAKGMTGGTILVAGNAGHETGVRMRRGLIAIGGNAGDLVGFNMIAGTVLVFGTCGKRAGAGMRRGTIGLLGSHPPPLLPTFRYAATTRPIIMPVMLRHVRERGLSFEESLLNAPFDFYQGDFVTIGRGEIVMREGSRPL